MQITLTRDYSGQACTLGVLCVGDLTLQTLELPWEAIPNAPCGKPQESCVGAGVYAMRRHDSPKHPKTWALVSPMLHVYHSIADIPPGCSIARTECLLHVANYPSQLLGCVGVGRTRSNAWGPWMILQSADAFMALQAALPWTDDHVLTISYAPGISP